MQFWGAATLSLDAKGRVAIPAKQRELLDDVCQGNLVVTLDFMDRCLLVYPKPAWETVQQELMNLPTLDHQARQVQRMMMGHAMDQKLDSHGRILVSPTLRNYAQLEKQAVLIGQGNKFELWDAAVWDRRCNLWISSEGAEKEMCPELKAFKY